MTVNVPIVTYPVDHLAMVEAGRVVEGLRVALNRTDGTLTELVTQLLEERADLLLAQCEVTDGAVHDVVADTVADIVADIDRNGAK